MYIAKRAHQVTTGEVCGEKREFISATKVDTVCDSLSKSISRLAKQRLGWVRSVSGSRPMRCPRRGAAPSTYTRSEWAHHTSWKLSSAARPSCCYSFHCARALASAKNFYTPSEFLINLHPLQSGVRARTEWFADARYMHGGAHFYSDRTPLCVLDEIDQWHYLFW